MRSIARTRRRRVSQSCRDDRLTAGEGKVRAIGRLLRWLGTGLLFLAIALCFAPTLVPPFLDRVYYRGAPSDHFDGARFFNPDADASSPMRPARFLNRMSRSERAQWPDQVAVHPTIPPRRVHGADMRVTWIGHATVLVQAEGLNILTDPIWSDRASPFSFVGPRRVRAPGIRFEDLPKIDLVVVSHNHYDHMDLPTLRRLWQRDRPLIVTSLGNDTILARAGIEAAAFDWGRGTHLPCDDPFEGVPPEQRTQFRAPYHPCGIVVERNHHWGSRWGTDRNRALWSAFTIRLHRGNVFFAGDTGWGDGAWARAAARHGPFRLAIIPIGAYEPREVMQNSHVNPNEAFRIFETLNPARAIGVHWGTFQLSFEPIDAPPRAIAALARVHDLAPDRFITTEVGQGFSVPAAR